MHFSRRTVSAGYTLLFKLVAATWIVGFGLATFAMLLWTLAGRSTPIWQFLPIWLVGSFVLWWSVRPLKKVGIDDGALRVSNYLKVASIPLDEIAGITEASLLPNLQVIVISLRSASVFGRKIVFAPSSRAAVRELREVAFQHCTAQSPTKV